MTKKLIIFLLLFFGLVFFSPNQVRAQAGACSGGMIDSMEFLLKIEGGSDQIVKLTESGPSQAIYRDSSNYYLDEQKTQKISDIGNVKINHSQSFLNQIALNKTFALEKTILFYGPGACENESRSLEDIKNKGGGSWDFNYTSSINDMECVFNNPITLELRDPLKTGDNLICSKSYQYSAGEIDSVNSCKISMTPSSGATIEDEVIIQGEDIDDGGSGIVLYLNGDAVNLSLLKILVNAITKETEFTHNIGALSAGDYLFEVRYKSGTKEGENICALRFPVVPAGAVPTPGQQLDASSSSQLQFDIAPTIPLCESIPIGTMCGKRSCQDLCFACEGKQGIWTGIGCMPTNFAGLVNSIFTTFSGILGGLILICILSNGIKIMISRGNPEALKKGQEGLTACIVGFLVLALSVLFLKIVGVDILHIFDLQ